MSLWQSGELLLAAAPMCGWATNILVQLGLYRFVRFTLMGSMLGGAVAGAPPLAFMSLWSFGFAPDLSASDIAALSLTVVAIYLSGSAAIFAVINLGETSLRIRMLQMLRNSPQGMKRSELIEIYNDAALFELRVDRLVGQRQVTRVGDTLIIRRSIFFYIAALIRAFRRLLYGEPSQR